MELDTQETSQLDPERTDFTAEFTAPALGPYKKTNREKLCDPPWSGGLGSGGHCYLLVRRREACSSRHCLSTEGKPVLLEV